MQPSEMLEHVDHTQLQAVVTWADIQMLCQEAIENKTASVCIPPSYVKRVKYTYDQQINICTVIGFPLGYSTTAAKQEEIKQALLDGANEIDMVINIGDVKNGDFNQVENEIKILKNEAGTHILKVIIETCYLTEAEKIKMCEIVTRAGADYIKTSTGFGTNGATLDDILLFKKHIGAHVQMKAAGGVKSIADLEMFLGAGCSRIGTSSAIKIVNNQKTTGY